MRTHAFVILLAVTAAGFLVTAVGFVGCAPPPAAQPVAATKPVIAERSAEAASSRLAPPASPTVAFEEPAKQSGPEVGPIRAEVASVRIGAVKRMFGGKVQETAEQYLLLEMRFTTKDETVLKRYMSSFASPKLADNFGNQYTAVGWPSQEIVGDSQNFSVRAGEPLVRIWAFETPLKTATSLDLTFAADIFADLDGQFKLTIPLQHPLPR